MGQYYRIVNLDKKEWLNPHRFGDGAKLLEFGDSATGTMLGLAVLLADGNGRGGGDLDERNDDAGLIGSWAGDRIVIAGDYADEGRYEQEAAGQNLYATVKPGSALVLPTQRWTDISDRVLRVLAGDGHVRRDLRDRLRQRRAGGHLADALPLPDDVEMAIYGGDTQAKAA